MDAIFYNNVLRRVKGIVYKINPNNDIDPEELISEAFLNKLPLCETSYVEWIIKKAGLKENRFQKEEREVQEYRVCKICKDNFPAANFRSWYLRGYLIHDSYCVKCRNKYSNEYKKRKRRLRPQRTER